MDDRRREIGLFRYSLAREPADPALGGAERGAMVRSLAAREHLGPDGRWVRVGRSTLDRWVRMLRAGGFEALVPTVRRGVPTTPAEVLELAETLKREVPERTAAQVRRVMLVSVGEKPMAVPSVRTLQRHYVRVGLNVRPDGGPPRVFGRFQAGRPCSTEKPTSTPPICNPPWPCGTTRPAPLSTYSATASATPWPTRSAVPSPSTPTGSPDPSCATCSAATGPEPRSAAPSTCSPAPA